MIDVQLCSPSYTSISQWTQSVNVNIKAPTLEKSRILSLVGCYMYPLAEPAMSQMKMMFTKRLSQRDYNALEGEATARVKVLNKMMQLGMSISKHNT
ncbi:hypothetical protein [Pectobacterium polonicum]|uniref:hypothetical protein n=1 Tax=Pectobacterium polonicum TaxID=2485124 RepID=UPI002B254B39|nr:hypothetical protein [Pectobacterium polonicum]